MKYILTGQRHLVLGEEAKFNFKTNQTNKQKSQSQIVLGEETKFNRGLD